MVDVGGILLGSSAVLSSLAAVITAIHNGRRIAEVHDEVKTANGKSIATLAELQEGRRIQTDISPGKRSVAEQAFVDQVSEEGSTK